MKDAKSVWAELAEIDKLTVHVLVDNETDGASTPCSCCDPTNHEASVHYTSEVQRLVKLVNSGKKDEIDWRKTLFAAHGLSLLLIAEAGGTTHTCLFDGGPNCLLWEHNAQQFELQIDSIETAVLSHWHIDHSVGLKKVAEMASAARTSAQQAPFVFDLHPDRPIQRGMRLSAAHGDHKYLPFNKDPEISDLDLPGCRVELHAEPHAVLDNFFYISGSIPRLTEYEQGIPSHCTLMPDGNWQLDPHIMDERYMAVKIKGKGAVVFSSCSHAGIVNVVTDVKNVSGGHVMGVMGGLHLFGRDCEHRIDDTVRDLVALDPHVVIAGHCTGWHAKCALAAALPGRFQPCAVGGTYDFLSAGDAS